MEKIMKMCIYYQAANKCKSIIIYITQRSISIGTKFSDLDVLAKRKPTLFLLRFRVISMISLPVIVGLVTSPLLFWKQ